MRRLLFLSSFLASHVGFSSSLSPPSPEYEKLSEILPPDYQGWFHKSNQRCLERIFAQYNIKTVVELGAWLGTSTIWFAERLPEDGVIYSIDTWRGSIEHNKKPQWKKKLSTLYNQFLSNVIHKGLEHRIYSYAYDNVGSCKETARANSAGFSLRRRKPSG